MNHFSPDRGQSGYSGGQYTEKYDTQQFQNSSKSTIVVGWQIIMPI